MTNKDLIDQAAQLIRPHQTTSGRLFGDVGAVVVTATGNRYVGVCVDTPSWGLCAERSAMAAMISNGEYRLRKLVAVWRNQKTGQLHVLPPCGVCREFIRQVNDENLDAEIILDGERTKTLRELIPECDWPEPIT
ncbi:cytidine deaminase [Rhizobium sp. CBN3]|uniref:cytidine deaminase family protein n=1 Tax=Rhizobium sp. CBN3 TaxID=3058045 RepID=UPI002671E80F|nr:cytidine deaminase [Rhizobium sp. CBN3]MDO3432130.1 cytidine deaminase [Rhizobium sp. CBN3]